jgi:hypothetical protein
MARTAVAVSWLTIPTAINKVESRPAHGQLKNSPHNTFVARAILSLPIVSLFLLTPSECAHYFPHKTDSSFSVNDSTQPKILSYVAIGARFEHTNRVFGFFRSS